MARLLAFRSCTTGCEANGTPFVIVADAGVVSESRLPDAGTPSAVKTTGPPEKEATTWFVPAVGDSVHDESVAMPAVSVVTVTVEPGLPVPWIREPGVLVMKVTTMPATGLYASSLTRTDGGTDTAVPTVAVWPDALFGLRAVAAAVLDTTLGEMYCARPGPSNISETLPTNAEITSEVNVAMPLALVVAVPPDMEPLWT